MDVYFLYSILAIDIFIIVFAVFLGLLRAYSAYIIGNKAYLERLEYATTNYNTN
jgi:hypothetical protein